MISQESWYTLPLKQTDRQMLQPSVVKLFCLQRRVVEEWLCMDTDTSSCSPFLLRKALPKVLIEESTKRCIVFEFPP